MPSCCGTKITYISSFWKQKSHWKKTGEIILILMVISNFGNLGALVSLIYFNTIFSSKIILFLSFINSIFLSVIFMSLLYKLKWFKAWVSNFNENIKSIVFIIALIVFVKNIIYFILFNIIEPNFNLDFIYLILVSEILSFVFTLPFYYIRYSILCNAK